MDFFERQAQAQRRTSLLVVYFVLAVVGIILTLHVVFSMVLGYSLWDAEAFGLTAVGVVGAVILGSVVKTIELSQGGRAVAAMLGGVPVDLNSVDPAERRLINVVEEMSLASGVPVPELYVLEGSAINAFAAGHGPGDTAIGVTRGCLERLSRDELQGVIGHEFSHILHGDMRLNLRLIGVLNGILFLALIGGFAMRMGAFSSDGSSSRDGRSAVSVGFAFLIGGLALYLVGWIGVFFGKLIKAAVSREREFLADASSVQYTRNPEGLAGALAKISKFSSRIESPRAEEASHMFFGNGTGDAWMALFATHPPIEERIERIAPGFDVAAAKASAPVEMPAGKKAATTKPGGRLAELLMPGQPQMVAAAALLGSLPDFSMKVVREIHGACSLVFALLISGDAAVRERQIALVAPAARGEVLDLAGKLAELSSAQKIALIDLAIPTLRSLSHDQYETFREMVRKFVEADGQIQLFEYTLQKILVRHLDLFFSNTTGSVVRFKSVLPILPDVGVLLSALAAAEPGAAEERDEAFRTGVAELLVKPAAFPLERTEVIALTAFDEALNRIAEASPDVKRTVLTACGAVVMHDGHVNDPQVELLRAIADTLDCPMPPFVHVA
jgi:Zn-dependent protease with chaperone function